MTDIDTATVRCSAWTRSEHVDPIGSCGSYLGFLLIDLPLPWPRDVGEIPEVAEIAPLLAGRKLRVQATVPGDGERQVSLYERGQKRRDMTVEDGLLATVDSLLGGGGAPSDGGHLLICTHGRRDVCCGSLGTVLAKSVDSAKVPDHVTSVRTSHTGGHRFAPTFIVLPEATSWAFADVDLIEQVLWRNGDPADVAARYRGCAYLDGPMVQAVEREVLSQVGWDLLDAPRSGRVVSSGPDESVVALVMEPPGGLPVTWEAIVGPGRVMAVPDCMKPINESKKTETEWKVADVRRLA